MRCNESSTKGQIYNYIHKKNQINNPNLARRRKTVIKIRAVVNKKENWKAINKISENKCWFFEKSTEMTNL